MMKFEHEIFHQLYSDYSLFFPWYCRSNCELPFVHQGGVGMVISRMNFRGGGGGFNSQWCHLICVWLALCICWERIHHGCANLDHLNIHFPPIQLSFIVHGVDFLCLMQYFCWFFFGYVSFMDYDKCIIDLCHHSQIAQENLELKRKRKW